MIAMGPMGLVNCVTGPREAAACFGASSSVRSRHDARSMPGHHTHTQVIGALSRQDQASYTLTRCRTHRHQASRINTRTHSQPASASRTSLGQVILRSPHDAMRSHALSTPPDRAAPHASLAGVLLRPWSRATACAPPPAASHQTTGTHTHTHTHVLSAPRESRTAGPGAGSSRLPMVSSPALRQSPPPTRPPACRNRGWPA